VIHVSDAKDLFEQISAPEGQVLRLDPVAEQQIGLVAGVPQGDDQVVERDGADVLHISAMVSEALDGATIDRVDTPQGPSFGLKMPGDEAPVA
jgi:Fe-S cluster assembly iron-binding protein IscA